MTEETKTIEQEEQETEKKNKRLTWRIAGEKNHYTVKLHMAEGFELVADLGLILPGFLESPEGLQELVKCGLREKVSQVHNQCISAYKKAYKAEIHAGTVEPMPSNDSLIDSVKKAIEALQNGQWPTDIKQAAEPKFRLSEIEAKLVAGMVKEGIPLDRVRAIVAGMK